MEDKEQKIKIQFDTNANKTAEEVRKLESATIKVEEAEIKLKKANEALANSTGKSVEEIRNLQIAQKKAAIATEDAKASVTKLSDTQEKAGKSSKSLGKNIEGLNSPITSAISGFKALVIQMFAIVANPIGAVLAVIVGAVALLGKAFLSTEAGGDKLQKGLAVIRGIFSGLLKVIEPIASFLVDRLIKNFELAGQAILATSAIIQKGLKAVGLDSAAAGLKKLEEGVNSNIKASKKLADAEADLGTARRNAQQTQLDFQNKAEKIRQKRDNDSNLSIAERSKLNKELAAVLKQQSLEELKIANLGKTVSDLRISQEGKSSENLDERAEALLKISDINERISGQESEQLANANSLRNEQKSLDKEAAAKRKADSDKRDADAKVIEDARLALIKEGTDKETALRLANEDLLDKTEEEKLARLKSRAAEEVKALIAKNIDVENITILNAKKFATLEKELEDKRVEENKEKDKVKFEKEVEEKAKEAANEKTDFENRLIILAERDALILANTALTEEERNKLLKENVDVRANIEKAEQDFKEQELQTNLGNLQNILSLGGKKMQKVAKALAIADVARTASKSVSESISSIGIANAKAVAASPLTGGMPFVAVNTLKGGLQIGSTIASAAKAVQSINSGGTNAPSNPSGGGAGGSSPSGGGAASSTPQVDFQASRENQIGNTVASNLNTQRPIQAFVVSKDITDQQQLDNNRINSNSI
jgi:hypothetical protein